MVGFRRREAALLVGLPGREQVIDDPRELVCRRRDRLGAPSLARMRRKNPPRTDWLRERLCAASRKA